MNSLRLLMKRIILLCMFLLFFSFLFSSASAYEATTLYNGCRGEEVREMQQALIDLGFLKGTADGIFGNNTENAVRAFQKKNSLVSDGLAGKKTRELILKKAAEKNRPKSAKTAKPKSTPKPTATPKPAAASQTASKPSSGSLFGGNYATIRYGDQGNRVKILQNALISAGYLSGKADGIFGKNTLNAVKAFQKSRKLTADGLAGTKTLSALENGSGSTSVSTPKPTAVPKPTATPKPGSAGDINDRISPPKASKLQLLHWFNDVKPSLSNGQNLLIYEPGSGLSWTLRILSRGRHCDAEPLTAKDTRTMLKAFGNVNTWSQKAVYVKLPDGRWTIGSTHDMPHQSGGIKNNDFDGHLCVHFLRDMAEAQKNDPSYGVSNQETIRKYWKKWTGQEISD